MTIRGLFLGMFFQRRSLAHFWAMRNGFYFTATGAELPIVWSLILALQFMLGDGPYALRASHK